MVKVCRQVIHANYEQPTEAARKQSNHKEVYKNKIKSEQIPCAESVAKNGCVCELQACYMSCSSWYRSHNLLAERVKRLITGEEALETLTQLNACENILRQVK